MLSAITIVRRGTKVLAISVALVVASAGLYFDFLQYEGNIHLVDKGKFYRSAQIDKEEFETAIKRYGIKSIPNLRGRNADQPWYENEIAVSEQFGVAHYDYPISASRTREQIEAIMQIVRAARKPILVHCQAGADRAGLVSALYSFVIEGKSTENPDEQLSRLWPFPVPDEQEQSHGRELWMYVEGQPAQLSNTQR